MLKCSSPNAYWKTVSNGLQCAFLNYPKGLSTIGVALKIGVQDSKLSGQTFLTLQSKLFDALKSPEEAFKYGITPTLQVFNDYSVVFLQFIPECSGQAQKVLHRFLSDQYPSHQSIIQSRYEMKNMELFGIVQPKDVILSLAHSASFGNQYTSTLLSEDPINLNPSKEILSSLQSRIIPIASSDMESTILNIASSLPHTNSKYDILPKRETALFKSSEIVKQSSHLTFSGSRLIKNSKMSHSAISFPAPSASHNDFYVYNVLEKLYGGGSQFSSEGYGVGFSSILYSHILGKYPIEEIRACYTPGLYNGLLSFWFKADPNAFHNISRSLKRSLKLAVNNALKNDKVETAKEQAILHYLKTIDKGSDLFLDFGCGLIGQGKTRSSKEIIQKLENVSKEDIIRCARNFLQNKPSIALIGHGDIKALSSPWM